MISHSADLGDQPPLRRRKLIELNEWLSQTRLHVDLGSILRTGEVLLGIYIDDFSVRAMDLYLVDVKRLTSYYMEFKYK